MHTTGHSNNTYLQEHVRAAPLAPQHSLFFHRSALGSLGEQPVRHIPQHLAGALAHSGSAVVELTDPSTWVRIEANVKAMRPAFPTLDRVRRIAKRGGQERAR